MDKIRKSLVGLVPDRSVGHFWRDKDMGDAKCVECVLRSREAQGLKKRLGDIKMQIEAVVVCLSIGDAMDVKCV